MYAWIHEVGWALMFVCRFDGSADFGHGWSCRIGGICRGDGVGYVR